MKKTKRRNPISTIAAVGVVVLVSATVLASALFSKKKTKKKSAPTPTPTPEPGPTTDQVPNISGDPAGYNTARWPTHWDVRTAFNTLGYPIPVGQAELTEPERDAGVIPFQRDWNAVASAVAGGRLAIPTDKGAYVPKGHLVEDGSTMNDTMNALEIAFANLNRGVIWEEAVIAAEIEMASLGDHDVWTGDSEIPTGLNDPPKKIPCPPGMVRSVSGVGCVPMPVSPGPGKEPAGS